MTESAGAERRRGVVMRGTGGVWEVRTEDGALQEVSMRGRLKKGEGEKLAVGDEVVLEEDARGGTWAIAEILPRRSRLARRAPGSAYGERVVVANADQFVIVSALADPPPRTGFIDRCLVAAYDVAPRGGERIIDHAFALGLKVVDFLIAQAHALLLLVIQFFAAFDERLIFLLRFFVGEKGIDVFANVLEIGMIQDGLAKLPCLLCNTVIFRC